jgi:hypothetical protein
MGVVFLSPVSALFLILEAALGAFVILFVAMGAVALGAWVGFGTAWFLLFLLYLLARLIVVWV